MLCRFDFFYSAPNKAPWFNVAGRHTRRGHDRVTRLQAHELIAFASLFGNGYILRRFLNDKYVCLTT